MIPSPDLNNNNDPPIIKDPNPRKDLIDPQMIEAFHKRDDEDLKRIVGSLYGRILEFVNEMVSYDEKLLSRNSQVEAQLKVQIERSEMDKRKVDNLKDRISELSEQLEGTRRSEHRANQQTKELSEAIVKLTEWNGRLEMKLKGMEELMHKSDDGLLKSKLELESQLLESTEKRIDLQIHYTKLEEELSRTKLLCKEHEDIQTKLRQENAVLKSKLFNCLSRPRSPKVSKVNSPRMKTPLTAVLDEVDLASESQTISDIFMSTFDH